MANVENPLTNALKLVQTTTVRGFLRLFTQTVTVEEGFSLELFRDGRHLGSISASQAQPVAQMRQNFQQLGARDGDMLYHVNLGPMRQLVQDKLRTYDGYTRDYSVTVELQVIDTHQFLTPYLQSADPVHLVILGIKEALQEYGDRTLYERMHPTSIQTQAKFAFDKDLGNMRAGIRIHRTYQPSLGVDANYQPINLSPLLDMKGTLTTLEGYTRDYEATVELQIADPQQYKYLEYTGADPLNLARIAIDGELQHLARLEFYEILSENQLRDIIEHTFDKHLNKINNGLKITKAHRCFLGAAKTYQPINRSPLLIVGGKLSTLEGYTRPYQVKVELAVFDLRLYLQLDREGADPLNLANVAIDGAIQRYACQQFYEDLSEIHLLSVVSHAFNGLASRVTGGLSIVKVHRFTLEADATYKAPDLNPLLTMSGKLSTLEGYVRPYEAKVELQIIDRRRFQQLSLDGIDPLNLANVTIDGAIQRYAQQQTYEAISEPQLHDVIKHTLDHLPGQTINGLQMVQAHSISLGTDPDYINLGNRPLTLTGTLDTTDNYTRDYEITVELEVGDAQEFVRLTRQGNNPLNLVKVAIEGAIHRAADGQMHDQLPQVSLHQAAHDAFTNTPNSTIGGLKIVQAHKVVLKIDPRKQAEADIAHQALVDIARIEKQADVADAENRHDFLSAETIEKQDRTLAQLRHEREKEQYLYDLDKDSIEEAHRLRKALSQWAYSQWVERASEALRAYEPVQQILEEMNTLSRALQSGLPQISEMAQHQQLPENNIAEEFNPPRDNRLSPETDQIIDIPSPPKRNEIWGLTLIEVRLTATLSNLANNQKRAFQIWEVTEGSLAGSVGFQETDILLKINGRYVFTQEEFEQVATSLQSGEIIKVVVLREEALTLIKFAHLQTKL